MKRRARLQAANNALQAIAVAAVSAVFVAALVADVPGAALAAGDESWQQAALAEGFDNSTLASANDSAWSVAVDGQRTYALGSSGTSQASMTVEGTGTLCFDWRFFQGDAGNYNFNNKFFVQVDAGDKQVVSADKLSDWATAVIKIEQDGQHAITWGWDNNNQYYPNTIGLDNIAFVAAGTKLKVAAVGDENVAVSVSVDGVPVSEVEAGTQVTFNATPLGEAVFFGWKLSEQDDACVSADSTYTLTVASDATLHAYYEIAPEGSQFNPYKLSSVADLQQLNSQIAQGTTFAAGPLRYFELTCDIDIAADSSFTGFSASASSTNYFGGELDGNGHVLSFAGELSCPLFPYLGYWNSKACVHDLTVQADVRTDRRYGAIFAGYATADISNVSVTGSVVSTATSSTYGVNAAGLVGALSAGSICGCTANVCVSVPNYSSNTFGSVGGLAGSISGTDARVESCMTSGIVDAPSCTMIGGVVGEQSSLSSVEGCCSTMTVRGDMRVGGIVGDYKGSTLKNCLFDGAVSATSKHAYSADDVFAGGIAGATSSGGPRAIENCIALMTVQATGEICEGPLAGGIIGAGGVDSASSSAVSISNCAALQAFVCASGNNAAGAQRIGNAAGANAKLTVADCYALADMLVDGQVVSAGDATGLQGGNVTVEQLLDEAHVAPCFSSFDPAVWTIVPGSLPCLANVAQSAQFGWPSYIQQPAVRRSINEVSVSVEVENGTFTGAELKPLVTVRDGQAVLVEGVDYELAYENNVDAASASAQDAPSVSVVGTGAYEGMRSVAFSIAPASLEDEEAVSVARIPDQLWTGEAIEPELQVSWQSHVLVPGQDYSVVYSDNVDASVEAKALVVGKGNFAGEIAVYFTITDDPLPGTELNPMRISGVEDLIELNERLEEGDSCSSAYYELVQDISVSKDSGFAGFNASTPFCGHFEGNGHTIVFDATLEAGLFSSLGSSATYAVVSNLNVEGNVRCADAAAGLLAARAQAYISSCTARGEVRGVSLSNYNGVDVGGLVGTMFAGSITECSSYANVSNACQDNAKGATGGIAGEAQCTVSACYSQGEVSALDCANTGGIVGKASSLARIGTCYSKAFVTGKARVGGIVGYLSGVSVTDCVFYGAVVAKATGYNFYDEIHAGGIVGQAQSNDAAIERCIAYGGVSATSEGKACASVRAAGIVGYADSDNNCKLVVKDCVALQSAVYADATASAGVNATTGRVAGAAALGKVSYSNNYAFNGMKAGSDVVESADGTSAQGTDVSQAALNDATAIAAAFANLDESSWTLSAGAAPRLLVIDAGLQAGYPGYLTGSGHVDLSQAQASIASQEWTGEELRPSIAVSCDGVPLVANIDYTVVYADNADVGRARAVLTGINNCEGTLEVSFTIAPADLTSEKYTVSFDGKTGSAASDVQKTYTGHAIEPVVTVIAGSGADKVELEPGQDFTVTYSNNVDPDSGDATALVEGTGNYTGSLCFDFYITRAPFEDVSFDGVIPDQVYTGGQIEPGVPDGTFNDTPVREDADFEVTSYAFNHSDNINVGTAYIELQGMGSRFTEAVRSYNLSNNKNLKFNIIAANLENAEVEVANQNYTGEPLEPEVVVKLDGNVLPQSDYSVAYSDNVDVGFAAVTVTAASDNVTGSASGAFEIVHADDEGADGDDQAAAPIGGVAAGKTYMAGKGASKARYYVVKPAVKGKVGQVWYKSFAGNKKKAVKAQVPATLVIKGGTYKVVGVRSKAFNGAKKLKTVVIGANVSKIKAKAFVKVPKLAKLTVKSKLLKKKASVKGAFKGSKLAGKLTVKVPKKLRKTYAKSFTKTNLKVPKEVRVK